MKKLLIIIFILFNSLYASEVLLQEVVNLSKKSLYNLDDEQLETILKPYLEKNKIIQALVITESVDNDLFLSFARSEDKISFDTSLFENTKNLQYFKSNISYDDEVIGIIELYLKNKETVDIGLTKEEKQWIDTHTVKVGVEPWAPVIFSNTGNDFNGITGDILKLIIEKSGLKVKVITDLWDPLLEAFKDKEIDLLPATYFTQKRATYGLYSKGYYKMLDYIYVKDDNKNIRSLKDLNGKRVAIPKGFGTIPKIQKKFPLITIVETQDLSDSIIRVLSGEVDALYEGQIAVEYKIQEELVTGLKGIPQSDFKASELHFFSRDDEPLLQSILEKSLKSIPFDQINRIKAKWLIDRSKVNNTSNNKIKLTFKEEAFIKEHPILRVSSESDYSPFDFTDDFTKSGKPVGYSIDIINLIAQKTGITIVYVNDIWSNLLTKIKNKEIDLIHTLVESKERKEFLLFSDGFIKNNEAIFTQKSTNNIKEYKNFRGKIIGLTKGDNVTSIIQKKTNKNFEIVLYDDYIKLLKSLSFGEVDAIIIDMNVGQYIIKEQAFYNLKKVGDVSEIDGIHRDKEFRIGIRDDYPILKDIINKGLRGISDKEFNELNNKWFSNYTKTQPILDLTNKEQQWLDKNQVIKYVYDPEWAPFEWKNELNNHVGMIPDILKLVSEKSE